MLKIFTDVKAAVTTRQSAVFYGLKVSANDMTCCPFHPDKHPSMKVDERYYCFGCHQTGDVIHFVASLFHLGQYEAAMKLANDFHIQVSDGERPAKKKVRRGFVPFKPDMASLSAKVAAIQAEAAQHQLEAWINHAADVLAQYKLLLGAWREEYAPQNDEDDWHPLFVEACTQANIVDYLFTLIDDPQEHNFLYTEYREEVKRIDERIYQYRTAAAV